MTRRRLTVAALLAAAVGWAVCAWLLWPRSMPSLDLPKLDPQRYFSDAQLDAAAAYSRFERVLWLLMTVAQLGALAWYVRNGRRWMRESAAGRIGTGMLLGMLGFALVWAVQLPFTVAELWWERRHGLTEVGYVDVVLGNWLALGGEFTFLCVALGIVMGLARKLGDNWWLPAAPIFVGLATLFAFVYPWLLETRPLYDPKLRAATVRLERVEGVPKTPVVVEPVRDITTLPNAEATGMGPSRRIILWDTLVDGRFTDREVIAVIAHEVGHLNHNDIWRYVGWYALFAFPGAFLIARITRREGGMAQPQAVPLSLFVLVALSLVAQPIDNVFSRRVEAAADWASLEAAKDPRASQQLFRRFVPTTLSEPSPPTWDYVLLENHPTIMQRIAIVQAWLVRRPSAARARRSDAGTRLRSRAVQARQACGPPRPATRTASAVPARGRPGARARAACSRRP
jgi:STE24 endopeptidase